MFQALVRRGRASGFLPRAKWQSPLRYRARVRFQATHVCGPRFHLTSAGAGPLLMKLSAVSCRYGKSIELRRFPFFLLFTSTMGNGFGITVLALCAFEFQRSEESQLRAFSCNVNINAERAMKFCWNSCLSLFLVDSSLGTFLGHPLIWHWMAVATRVIQLNRESTWNFQEKRGIIFKRKSDD